MDYRLIIGSLFLAAAVSGLKIRGGTEQANDAAHELAADIALHKGPCSRHEFIGPLVEVTRDHFIKKHNVTVYPWALTMLSALEVGGLATDVGGEEFVADHDLDFLLNFPPEASDSYIEGVIQGWREELLNGKLKLFSTTSIVDWMKLGHPDANTRIIDPKDFSRRLNAIMESDLKENPTKLSELPSFRDRWRNHMTHYFIEVVQNTEITQKLTESRIVQRTIEASINYRTDFAALIDVPVNKMLISALDATMDQWGAGYLGKRTLVDFWVTSVEERKERWQKGLKPDPVKKMLFAGVEFPFPSEASHEVAFDVERLLCPVSERPKCSIKKLCDLYLPHGHYEHFLEDFTAQFDGPGRKGSKESELKFTRIAKSCTAQLHQQGYASMNQCARKSDFPDFRQRTSKPKLTDAQKRLAEIRSGKVANVFL